MHPTPEQSKVDLKNAKAKASAILGKYKAIMSKPEVGLCVAQPDKTAAHQWLSSLVELEGRLASRSTKPKAKTKGF